MYSGHTFGLVVICITIWVAILFYLLNKSMNKEISGWWVGGFTIFSFILLGLIIMFS